jgi:hypothetical protein
MNRGRFAVVMLVLCATVTLVRADANNALFNFCQRHQGQQVGDGICQTLVDEARRAAGLPVGRGYGREMWRISSTPGGVVISGDFRRVLPGDIIYFHDIDPDRSHHRESTSRFRNGENHVGVVESLNLDGVRYFNQNAGHQKMVRSDYFPFTQGIDMVDYVAVFRP